MQKLKILIVEDNPMEANALAETIRAAGYDVVGTAKTADAAIFKFREYLPDLVLMDIELKHKANEEEGLDGIHVAQVIDDIKKVPIIYTTAHYDDEELKKRMCELPNTYSILAKPFIMNGVSAAIEVAWAKFMDKKEQHIFLKFVKDEKYYVCKILVSEILYITSEVGADSKEQQKAKGFVPASGELEVGTIYEGSFRRFRLKETKISDFTREHNLDIDNSPIFMRTSSQYIVNVPRIDAYQLSEGEILFKNCPKICYVGDSYKKEFRKRWENK